MEPRIGVNTIAVEIAGWADHCRRLEALGVDEISVADHLVPGAKSPMVALAVAAAVTERVTLSTMVLNNELRHPGELANEAAFLAEVSGGRFILGLGAGYAQSEHDAIGVPLPPADQRIRRLGESVAALRALLRGDEVTTDGPEYRFTAHRAAPVPSSPVPVLVGGGSPKVQEVAARHADILGLVGFSNVQGTNQLTHFSAARLDERLERVRAMAGDRAEELQFQALVQQVCITDDREARAVALAEEWKEEGLDVATALDSPFLLIGTAAEIAAQLRERTDRWGIETWTTFSGRDIDASLEDLGEIVRNLRS